MRNKHLTFLILLLCVVGGSLFSYKHFVLGFPLTPTQTASVFNIEAELAFTPSGGPVKLSLLIPDDPPNFTLLNEHFVSPNYSVTTSMVGDNRESTWAIRRASGEQKLFYRLQLSKSGINTATERKAPTGSLGTLPGSSAYQAAIDTMVEQVRAKSADITTFSSEAIHMLNNPSEDNTNVALVLDGNSSPENITKVAINILAGANIHAQIVHGLYLTESQVQPNISVLLTAWTGDKWIYIDPVTGKLGLPNNFLIWWYGEQKPVELLGGSNLQQSYSVSIDHRDPLAVSEMRQDVEHSTLVEFSLFKLPIQTQQVYNLLLTLPLGVFVILLLRSFIGIKTFGTFMPALVALSFRDTELLYGIIFFSSIVSIGLLVRFYVDQFKLLMVPRLAAILTVVVLLMALFSVITFKLGFISGLSIALFPMVILAMTIERMSIVWEERGASEAIQQGIGTLFSASLAYLVMRNHDISYLVFVYPELLLVLLAVMLLIGRYHGYRLSELIRFRALIKKDHSL